MKFLHKKGKASLTDLVFVDKNGKSNTGGKFRFKKITSTNMVEMYFHDQKIISFKQDDGKDENYNVDCDVSKLFIYNGNNLESFRTFEVNSISHVKDFDDGTYKRTGKYKHGKVVWSEFEPLLF